jgi:hypothetical protein
MQNNMGVENDCKVLVPFSNRSAFAKFRCGVAPIRLETGRYENIRLEERCCFNCSNLIVQILENKINLNPTEFIQPSLNQKKRELENRRQDIVEGLLL